MLAEVASGEAQVVVGTHALMQEGVAFHDLALAIVDEQHRFGVHQRLALRDKGAGGSVASRIVPHQLVMTATPIPRTLAMAAYADLDVSAIDELPPGRTPVQTVALSAERRPELVERIRARLRRRPAGVLGLHADRRQRRSRRAGRADHVRGACPRRCRSCASAWCTGA